MREIAEQAGADAEPTWAWLQAILLGAVEAATEFLPVSSTGHLILLTDLLGFHGPPGRVFEVSIQLGAVLAVCVLYWARLSRVVFGLRRDPAARHFAITVIIAVLPAVVVGVLLHGWIKAVLFSPFVVCASLIIGGIAILIIDRGERVPRFESVERMPYRVAVGIGAIQCLAMVPGVSRSGATILGALLLGADRRTAAEFSFFLAVPTMFGAVTWDLWKNRDVLTLDGGILIALGFGTAFLVSLLVVRWLIGFVSRHSFRPFAWYRIAVGSIMLLVFALR